MIRIKLLRDGAKMPEYVTVCSACRDIYIPENVICLPYKVTLIPTGWAIDIPYGYEMQIRMRSGLALKFPSYLSNGVGTIDSDYRDEVMLPFTNHTGDVVQFMKGDRIAQCIIKQCTPYDFVLVDDLDKDNDRGGGLGSTGGN